MPDTGYALLNIRKVFNLNCVPGILPFIALSYMNLHIFLKIRQSRQVIIKMGRILDVLHISC